MSGADKEGPGDVHTPSCLEGCRLSPPLSAEHLYTLCSLRTPCVWFGPLIHTCELMLCCGESSGECTVNADKAHNSVCQPHITLQYAPVHCVADDAYVVWDYTRIVWVFPGGGTVQCTANMQRKSGELFSNDFPIVWNCIYRHTALHSATLWESNMVENTYMWRKVGVCQSEKYPCIIHN